MGEDPEEVLEILNLYLSGMEGNLIKLDLALSSGNNSEVDLIAHNCGVPAPIAAWSPWWITFANSSEWAARMN